VPGARQGGPTTRGRNSRIGTKSASPLATAPCSRTAYRPENSPRLIPRRQAQAGDHYRRRRGPVTPIMVSTSYPSSVHRPRLHPAIGPFFLLTVLTSLAFNRATLARQAGEDQRRHLVQINLLQDELRKLTPLNAASERSSCWSSCLWRSKSSTPAATVVPSQERDAAEEESLARKCLAVGLDPQRLGVSPQYIPNLASSGAGGSDVTWSEALFGKGTWGKMKTSLIEAGAALRASVGAGAGNGGSETGAAGAGAEAKEHDEYEAAFLQYTQRLEEEERSKTQAPPAEARSPQYEPSPTQHRTISTEDAPLALHNDAASGGKLTSQSEQVPVRRRFIV
jgi:hypothetical protein